MKITSRDRTGDRLRAGISSGRFRLTRRRWIGVAIVWVGLMLILSPVQALSKTVILRLKAAARAQYDGPGDSMDRYHVMLYGGKAYGTTRGTVAGMSTIAVWEYVPPEWHRIFDYPLSDASSPDVAERYRSYGFSAAQQKRLLSQARPFPAR